MIWHAVKEVEAEVPAQRDIRLNSLLNLLLRRDAVQEPDQQIFHDDHRINGRPAKPLAV